MKQVQVQEANHPFFAEYYKAKAEKDFIATRNVFGNDNVYHATLAKCTPILNENHICSELSLGYVHDTHEIINKEGYYRQHLYFNSKDENGNRVYKDRLIKAVHLPAGQLYRLYIVKLAR